MGRCPPGEPAILCFGKNMFNEDVFNELLSFERVNVYHDIINTNSTRVIFTSTFIAQLIQGMVITRTWLNINILELQSEVADNNTTIKIQQGDTVTSSCLSCLHYIN